MEKVNQLTEMKNSVTQKTRQVCNTGMLATAGAIASDQLEDGKVVSGIGQYNFVSMAHAIPDARDMMIKAPTVQEKSGQILFYTTALFNPETPRHSGYRVQIADIRGSLIHVLKRWLKSQIQVQQQI